MADLAAALKHYRESPRRTAHEAIVTTVREAIFTGALPPGTRLVQSELARQFGVSNTPVREALRELAAESLLQFDPFRGAVVRTPTLEEIREVYELSTILTPHAVRRAVPRLGDAELARLRELHERMCVTEDPSTWTQLNREFHDIIEAAAASPRLSSFLQGLRDARMLQVILTFDTQRPTIAASNREHAELLDAIERRDADRAAELILGHVGASLAAVETQLAKPEQERS